MTLPSQTPEAHARMPLAPRAPPSLSDKIWRGLWSVVWNTLFRFSPVPMHGWRRFLLRLFGSTIGPRSAIYPGARIWAPWNLIVGEGATIGSGATLYSVDRIEIGQYAIVSQNAHLCTASHDYNSPAFELTTAPIKLEREAWVAAEAFLAPGVTLGEGSVALARAVIVRSLPARAIAAGNPSRIIGWRNADARNRLGGRRDCK